MSREWWCGFAGPFDTIKEANEFARVSNLPVYEVDPITKVQIQSAD